MVLGGARFLDLGLGSGLILGLGTGLELRYLEERDTVEAASQPEAGVRDRWEWSSLGLTLADCPME